MTPQHAPVQEASSARLTQAAMLAPALLLVVLVATHWATLRHLADRWANDPQYSHGFIVPIFALVVLWSRREMLKRMTWKPAWIGWGLLAAGVMMRVIAAESDFEPLDSFSLLPTVFGLVLLVGGWSVLRWSWPALAFLAFMMPLPYAIETALSQPLRRLATVVSTYALQTAGCPAIAEGNIILIDDVQLGVEQACSGLGMLMTFFALATALAMIVETPWHDRLALIISAIPIAVVVNVIRITATGVAYHLGGKGNPTAHLIYHDLAGWLMMPLALGMLWLELKFFANLFVELREPAPVPLAMPRRSEFEIELPKVVTTDAPR